MRLLPIFIVLSILPAATAAEPKRAGADWWSLQKLRAVAPPAVAGLPADANPIDAFVRAKLRDNGLTPSPPADRRTLIRRLTFDITGLPPSPAEVDAFLADTSAEAYERVVDRLLAAPGYGERWGRHWLDVVRYSESHGFEYDRLRDHGWRYRDYVIKSLNDDKPYADFVREQLAGDVLPRATREGIAATGFLVAGPFDQAGAGSVSPIVRGKVREDELEDTLGTVGQTFLGATMNCARCHDHKVDPYTARDYYRMKAVFEGVYAGDRPLQTAEEIRARGEITAALDKRIADVQAVLALLDSAARRRVLAKRPAGTAAPDTSLPKPVARWTFDVDGRDSVGELHAIAKNGAKFAHGRLVVDGTAAFAETPPLPFDLKAKTLEAWVAVPTLDQGGGGVISVQTTGGRTFDALTFAERQPRQWTAGSEGFIRTRDVAGPDETAAPNELIHLAITYTAEGRITLFRNGRPYGDGYAPAGQTLTFKAKEARVLFGLRHTGGARPFLKAEIEEARLYDTALTPEQVLASDRAGVERVTPAELAAAMTAEESATAKTANETLARLRREWDDARQQALAYAANPRQPGATIVLKRGDVEKPGEAVTAGSPAVVQGPPGFDLPAAAPEGERRRAFAEWVVHADNPLTWRVIVNRAWQHHFGEGIVRTPNDFGLNGERPTHPELLDWLAGQFRAGGGRLKSLHKLIVMSTTYRQASAFDANQPGDPEVGRQRDQPGRCLDNLQL